MKGFTVTIKESSKQLTAKERVQIKATNGATRIDKATEEGHVYIDVDYYAILNVHNENSDNEDYDQLLIVAKDGERYVTGSESFTDAFLDIMGDMADEAEAWELDVFRMPSSKRDGKYFLTCSVR